MTTSKCVLLVHHGVLECLVNLLLAPFRYRTHVAFAAHLFAALRALEADSAEEDEELERIKRDMGEGSQRVLKAIATRPPDGCDKPECEGCTRINVLQAKAQEFLDRGDYSIERFYEECCRRLSPRYQAALLTGLETEVKA